MNLCFDRRIFSKAHTKIPNRNKEKRFAVKITRLRSSLGPTHVPGCPGPRAHKLLPEDVVLALKTGELFTPGLDLPRNRDFYVAKSIVNWLPTAVT